MNEAMEKLLKAGYNHADLMRQPASVIRRMAQDLQPPEQNIDEVAKQDFLQAEFPKLMHAIKTNEKVLQDYKHRLSPTDIKVLQDEIDAMKIKLEMAQKEVIDKRQALYNEIYPQMVDMSGNISKHFKARLGMPDEPKRK